MIPISVLMRLREGGRGGRGGEGEAGQVVVVEVEEKKEKERIRPWRGCTNSVEV